MHSNLLFLAMRVFHIVLGAAWLGTAVAGSFFFLPSIAEAGPEGGKIIVALVRRKFMTYIASVSGLTVLTGFWLYWRFTSGFDPGMSASSGGKVFGAGGVLGLIAAILAVSGVSRNVKKVLRLMAQMNATSDEKARAALLQQATKHRHTAMIIGRIVALLLIMTAMLMAVGHYV
jgi:hypothetical protein